MRRTQAQCPQCGRMVPLTGGVEARRCPDCRAEIPRAFTYTATLPDFPPHPNRTPLRPGMKASFFGRQYELIGRVVLSMQEEDGTYYWDEFELVSEDGRVLFLEYDEGEWKLMEAFQPAQPLTPEQAWALLQVGTTPPMGMPGLVITERAQKRIEFIQGQLTYRAQIGETAMYADARRLDRLYSIEWTADEIEYYRGMPLAERDVYIAFGLKDIVREMDQRETTRRSQTLFAAVCLVLALLAFIGYGMSLTSGRVIDRNTVPIDAIGPDGVRFGPITLDPGQRLYRLAINGSMDNASAWVAGVLEAADGTELIGTQRDFWDESGYDADGYWHESDLHAQTDFSVQHPGPYFVHLYAEKDPSPGTFGTAGYELRAGVTYPSYLLVYGIGASLVAILFFVLGSWEKLEKATQQSADD
ncbi:MAG: DUF4178 domain-containing protein [Chloroherpetonaceae bacterium]|nr:DUF4178 domain-containing protein [Chthonomonadaceae bacterium]MDW8208863.1 DUF4178 domain-containing protein [Chloroherpetonaceae bacterium]